MPSASPDPGVDPAPARLVIHIGLQKTGTTFLQRALRDNREDLAARGLHQLDPGAGLGIDGGAAHHFLAHALLGRRLRHTPDAGFDRLEAHVAALRAALAEASGTAVISSEDFSRFRRVHVERLRALFPDPAPDVAAGQPVRILVYLRRQDLWLDALYGQMQKVGNQQPLADFIEQNRSRLDYKAFLAPWIRVFGPEALILRVYEGFGAGGQAGGLWADFCTALDCPQAASVLPRQAQANVSPPPEVSRYLAGIGDRQRRHRLRGLVERCLERAPMREGLVWLSEAQAREILSAEADRNRRIAKRHLGRKQLFEDETITLQPPLHTGWRARLVVWRYLATGLGLRLADRLRGG